jgi:predicted naringenin-chalcone synthase
MYLNSISTAQAAHRFTQLEIWSHLQNHPEIDQLKPRSMAILEKILTHTHSGIHSRHFSSSDLQTVFTKDAQSLNESFEKHAPELASQALIKAVHEAGLEPDQIDALFLCTCTGYLCPGPSSHVAEMVGLRSNAYLVDLVGLGCGAAIPTLRAAHGYLAANPTHRVAVIAVEISSAAFYLDNDPGVLISLCLFGDGAAAAILSGQPTSAENLQFHNFDTHHVPGLAAQAVSTLYQRRKSDPEQILAHSGGRDVIEAIESAIPEYKLTETREMLRENGNLSSPSVLFALEQRLKNHPDTRSLWLTAFGAGFAAHSCHLSR